MITHFQHKPLYDNQNMAGWRFSFYFNKEKHTGIYQANGIIEWTSSIKIADKEALIKQVHELMSFHVYDQ
ncbi:hypothetical protein CHH80_22365 [Bacillus sp. 7504-2]|nr:hypothetical protein CHH80_22365 [Bacillus sp. 7504-2]